MWNFISALTFPIGAVFAYLASWNYDVAGLVLFGAGNFIYIAASDLIPEIKSHARLGATLSHFAFFAAGLLLMFTLAVGISS